MVRRAGVGRTPWVCALGVTAILLLGSGAAADPVDPSSESFEDGAPGFVRPGLLTPGLAHIFGGISLPSGLQPFSQQRWDGIVRQHLDAGCGPASLATFYTNYLGLPVSEEQMARALTAESLRRGRPRADIQRRGYSLGELKRVAERGRLVTAAFKPGLYELHRLQIPVITHMTIRGYGHFVVVRGVIGDRVIVADPNFGNMTYPLGQFAKSWTGAMLAIGRPTRELETHVLDASLAPHVQEIDLSTFEAAPELPKVSMLRYQFQARTVSVTLRPVVAGADIIDLVSFENAITEFNAD